VNVPEGLAASPLATPAPGKENRRFADYSPHQWGTPTGPAQALFKIAPGNFVLSLFPPAFGPGTSLHPCRLCPLGASLRLAPACGQRFVDFQPDSPTLTLLSRLKGAPVLSPR